MGVAFILRRTNLLLIPLCFAVVLCAAQEPVTSSPRTQGESSTPSFKTGDKKPAGESQGKKDDSAPAATSNDRLFFALPNFLTLENAGQVPPMRAKQKFSVIVRS